MDFHIKGSDNWESDTLQDKFINNYFMHKQLSSFTDGSSSSKSALKRKKQKLKSSANQDTNLKRQKLNDSEEHPEYSQQSSITLQTQQQTKEISPRKKKKCNRSERSSESTETVQYNVTINNKFESLKKKRKQNSIRDQGKADFLNMKTNANTAESNAREQKFEFKQNQTATDVNFQNEPNSFKRTELNARSSTLSETAKKNLQAAKFRLLNEKLYTLDGHAAHKYFKQYSDSFLDYHHGYELQVKKWPVNPVDLIIGNLKHKPNTTVIADMGCGDAKIAQAFPKRKVHSFDLVALNDLVTRCDMSKVPLEKESVDVAVFCLSLMGVNLKDYLMEAFRILKHGGLLKIAEVESRIENLGEFIKSIEAYGFASVNKDIGHKMFVLLDFNKIAQKQKKQSKLPQIHLNPCWYKRR